MKKLILHIGYPKTGTTGLQVFFEKNKLALDKIGVLYPEAGKLNGAHYLINFSLGIGNYDKANEVPKAAELKDSFMEEVQRSHCETVIVSSEYFITSKAPEEVKEFFNGFDTKIIIYLRRHDYALESGFAQGEKTVANPPWEAEVASFALHAILSGQVPYDYLRTLRRWAEVFGKDNIIVRPFEKQQNTPDLFTDFLSAVGISDSADFTRPGMVNSSLGRESLLALRMARKLNIPATAKEKIVSAILNSKSEGSSDRYFTPAMRNVVVSKYAPSYVTIAREFMDRADGILFLEPMPRPNDPWVSPPDRDLTDVVGKILSAVAALLK